MAAILAIVSGGSAHGQAPPSLVPSALHTEQYGISPVDLADYYFPVLSTTGRAAPGVQYPALVMIHGGGWTTGSRLVYRDFAQLLAENGITGITADYRLIVPGQPSTYWPTQLEDAQLLIRWVKTRALALHINDHQICVEGDSAGGQLALFIGAHLHRIPGDESNLLTFHTSNIDCVIDNFSPVTWGPTYVQPNSISPLVIDVVNPRSAPTMIFQGTLDPLVNPSDSVLLLNTLQADGVSASLTYFDAGHGYAGLPAAAVSGIEAQEIAFVKAETAPFAGL